MRLHDLCLLASQLGAEALITITSSGATACRIARNRPQQQIIAFSTDEKVIRQLMLVWGVKPLKIDLQEHTEQMHEDAKKSALSAGFVDNGDVLVIVSGMPVGVAGSTNMIKVDRI